MVSKFEMCQEFNGHGHNLGEEVGYIFLKGLTKIQAQTCEDFF